ncbi:MAG TPA: hypothetical protein VGX03_22670 [Candidatus Binatia bacterium]|jgi:hypothetical protein|nr:hypothetical protein [Candidatus Binatia bacterium]
MKQAADHTPFQKVEKGTHWERWLEELRALPAEAQEWEGVAAFVATLQQLTEIKRQERESRARLQLTLTQLATQCTEELVFFDLTDVSSWTAKACPLAEVFTQIAQVEQFQVSLLRHRELRQQPTTNAVEDRRRRKALDELDEDIIQHHSRLAAVLLRSPAEQLSQPAQPQILGENANGLVERVPVALLSPPPSSDVFPLSSSSVALLPSVEDAPAAVEIFLPEPGQLTAEQVSVPTGTNGAAPTITTEEDTSVPFIVPLGLPSPQEAATRLQGDDRDENWHTLLWSCIAADDLPMAYWLARSLRAGGRPCPVPDWLLAAGQGARWLSPPSEDFAREVLEIVRTHEPDTDEIRLVGLAAALRCALLAPNKELVRWLVASDCGPALHNLVSTVTAFLSRGRASRPEDWENAAEFRTSVAQILPEVEAALTAMTRPCHSLSLAAAVRCLQRAIGQLREAFLLPLTPSDTQPLATGDWGWLPFGTRNLFVALSRRLLWLPEIKLDDDGQPDADALPHLAPLLRDTCATGRTLRAALEGWLEQQDYRFVDILLHVLHRSETDFPALSRCYQDALADSRAALREQTSHTQIAIEQAVVDGIITDERTHYNAKVEAIHPDETLHFAPRYAALQQIRLELAEAREQRATTLHRDWQNLQTRLTGVLAPAQWEQVSAFVQSAVDRGATRLVEKALARLAARLETDSPVEEGWSVSPTPTRSPLAEFLEATPHIEAWMEKEVGLLQPIATDIRQGRSRAGIAFGELPAARVKEASSAIETWRQLKQRKLQGDGSVQSITLLLRYLGFTLDPGVAAPVQLEQRGGDWLQVRAHIASGELTAPLPQLGSQAEGRYEVACVWQRPGVDTLTTWLRDVRPDTRLVIVFYLGRLTPRQRRDLMCKAQRQELSLLVLDETLLVFLAGERGVRLPVFLSCTLPFAAVNPYTLPRSGEVAPEMFFGRKTIVRQLREVEESCLVYGGRHVGKSALLHYVRREFHHPEREHYAWGEDLQPVGTPPDSQSAQVFWQKLRDACKAAGIIPQRVITDKPEEVAKHLVEALRAVPQRRLLVLYDNADQFLNADAKDRFRVVEGLRKVMVDTQKRFKVIFAGGPSVHRFHSLPYQPLASFGDPLMVGPLEPDAARKLVTEPFAALGYRFVEEAAVLRILSYTNYYPGLVQLFCHELLTRLQERPDGDPPPYPVEQSDVEDIFRNRKVRDSIREQFEATLALDPRYQALTWSMIIGQQQAASGSSRAYTPVALRQIVQQWWPQGANPADEVHIQGLLEEMCGLGVLSRNGAEQYQLRNPNLMRLLGTDLEDRLLTLAQP